MRPPLVPTTLTINKDDSKQTVIMKTLYNSLIEYREPKTHRILIQLFMYLPSRKDFPEYFNIIEKPICMNKIKDKIERHIYPDENSCMEDFKLMFRNCKFFNEDDSQIYLDAVTLENVLKKRREQIHIEFNNKNTNTNTNDYNNDVGAKETILNSTTSSPSLSTNIHNSNTSTPTRQNNFNNTINNHVTSNYNSSPSSSATNKSVNDNSSSDRKHETKNSTNHINDNTNSGTNFNNSTNTTTTTNNNDNISNNITTNTTISTGNSNSNSGKQPSTPNKSLNLNSGSNDVKHRTTNNMYQESQIKSDSTNGIGTNDESSLDNSIMKITHNHHNETSMDSSSNLSADLLASTPVEKCSLNTRRGKNSDAPKRQLLTGYIIYASEIRKQVIDKNPNQNFGDISRLVGNEWKALAHDVRSKYDQRALIHNKRVRERLQRELSANGGERLSNGHTPKLTKRKLAKLAKEQMRQHHLSISGLYDDSSSTQSPKIGQERRSSMVSQASSTNFKSSHQQQQLQLHHSQPQTQTTHQHHQTSSSKTITVETSTQTTAIRFVEPPTKKRLAYSETFKKYIESLPVPNKDLLVEETPERPAEDPSSWLGNGIGRHESPEAALWALRDFMLQDAVTMRRSMEPYL